VAVKIKLKRMGKIREPYYRIVVADARTKRDGRAIEEIGKYHPKADPSFIEVNSERAQHWLSVGAQPTDPVRKLLEVTGDWQRFKGLPGAEGTLKAAAPRGDKKDAFAAALAETHAEAPAAPKGRGRAGGKAGDAKAADAKAGEAKAGDAKAADAKVGDAKAADTKGADAKARDAKAADDTGQPKAGGAKRGAKADEDKGEKPEKRTRSARSGGAKGDSATSDSAQSDVGRRRRRVRQRRLRC
jgi:small subunit ribosomal protein S16